MNRHQWFVYGVLIASVCIIGSVIYPLGGVLTGCSFVLGTTFGWLEHRRRILRGDAP